MCVSLLECVIAVYMHTHRQSVINYNVSCLLHIRIEHIILYAVVIVLSLCNTMLMQCVSLVPSSLPQSLPPFKDGLGNCIHINVWSNDRCQNHVTESHLMISLLMTDDLNFHAV